MKNNPFCRGRSCDQRGVGRARGSTRRGRLRRAAIPLVAGAMLAALAAPAQAATGVVFAGGLTVPSGAAVLGSDMWVADHLLGFCRLDADAAAPGGFRVNQGTCSTAVASPGQVSVDAVNNFVYVPDNSSKSKGVTRLTWDPVTRTVGAAMVVAPGKGLGGIRTTAAVLGPDGALYVSALKTGNIKRVPNLGAAASSQVVQTIGNSSDGRGVNGLAFVGADLYLAEGAAVTVMGNAPGCTSSCAAGATGVSATAPTAITASGSVLYVAETPVAASSVLRYDLGTSVEDVYANASADGTAFQNVAALALDSGGNLYVGDDPTAGDQVLQGHLYQVAPPAAG